MEPSQEEFRQFSSLNDICTWVGLPGDPHEQDGARGALLFALGADDSTHWRAVAAMSVDDYQTVLDGCLTADEQGAEARLTPTQLSQAGLVGRFARVCGGASGSPHTQRPHPRSRPHRPFLIPD